MQYLSDCGSCGTVYGIDDPVEQIWRSYLDPSWNSSKVLVTGYWLLTRRYLHRNASQLTQPDKHSRYRRTCSRLVNHRRRRTQRIICERYDVSNSRASRKTKRSPQCPAITSNFSAATFIVLRRTLLRFLISISDTLSVFSHRLVFHWLCQRYQLLVLVPGIYSLGRLWSMQLAVGNGDSVVFAV